MKNKRNKGITLIALVVTIIVLLILAGISIAMLSGNNGILQRATDAKTLTGIEQEKEIVALAYNSALAKKISNGDSTSVTAGDMNTELANQGASADGSNPITVIFTDSKRQYTINANSKIEYAGMKNDANSSNIQLSITSTETESRAIILEVTATIKNEMIPTEQSLKSLSQEELQIEFLNAIQKIGAPFTNWDELEDALGGTSQTVASAFVEFELSSEYSDEYDLIIQTYSTPFPLNATFTCDGNEAITGTSAKFIVTNPNPKITATTSNGDSTEIIWNEYPSSKIETYSTTAVTAETEKNSKTITARDNQTVEVPAGFYYGINDKVGKVSTGFVITDSIDENGYSNGNEFVWIPIDKTNLTVGKTSNAIAEISSGTNYHGVAYNFGLSTPTRFDSLSIPYYYKEPAITTLDLAHEITEESIQQEYNDFIKSIMKYGGFYVARYELSILSFSKIGMTPTSTRDTDTYQWYGLYSKAKSYTNMEKSVISSMIWGSQYDAILNFALAEGNDRSKVTSIGHGNHTGTKLQTGLYNGEDSINNIFDLEGNLQEWTLEAYGSSSIQSRVRRGSDGLNGANSPGNREQSRPDGTSNFSTTRLSLYIK
ncbi:MAG TPA: hypothetical protein DEP51_04815 [Clostridiales bacterium]|nr:hypothetical protein [Clostridiales bacterium]